MPDIRDPDGAATPYARGALAAPSHTDARAEEAADEFAPQDSPWQSAVVRVSTMIAVWLGY